MNAIAQLLAQKAQKTHFPLELPTLDDVIEAQEAMLIHIPIEMRDYLLNSSDSIYGALEPVTLADQNSHTYLPDVASNAWERGMPREMLPFCEKGKSIYCVSEDGEVFLWREELGDECEPVCDDVWQWVRDIWLEAESDQIDE